MDLAKDGAVKFSSSSFRPVMSIVTFCTLANLPKRTYRPAKYNDGGRNCITDAFTSPKKLKPATPRRNSVGWELICEYGAICQTLIPHYRSLRRAQNDDVFSSTRFPECVNGTLETIKRTGEGWSLIEIHLMLQQ